MWHLSAAQCLECWWILCMFGQFVAARVTTLHCTNMECQTTWLRWGITKLFPFVLTKLLLFALSL